MDCIDDFFMSVYLVECVLKIYVMRREVKFPKTIYFHKNINLSISKHGTCLIST